MAQVGNENSEVAELRASLEAARRDLDAFVYSVSHDLRGPLRSIMAASMILLEDFSADLPEEAQSQLRSQAVAAKRINALVEDLLRLSRLGREGANKQTVDVSEIAREIARNLLPNAKVTIEPGLTANADPALLSALLAHVFDNCGKFSSPARPLEVSLIAGAAPRELVVRDNGIGIEASNTERIFLPFEKINGDAYPGSGMGLAFCKKIVDRHDGKIRAEGSLGIGTAVHFVLP